MNTKGKQSSNLIKEKEKGQALIEFALVISIFLMVVLGGMEFGRMIYTKHILDKATREAARAGSVRLDNAEAVSAAQAVFNNVITQAGLKYTSTNPPVINANVVKVNGVDALSVKADFVFQSTFTVDPNQNPGGKKILSIPPVTLTSTSVMRKEG